MDALLRMRSSDGPSASPLLSDLAHLEIGIKKVVEMLDECVQYVDAVLRKERPADDAIGRCLADAVASVPSLEADFEKMFAQQLQDCLLVVYLANLARAQLAIGERLGK